MQRKPTRMCNRFVNLSSLFLVFTHLGNLGFYRLLGEKKQQLSPMSACVYFYFIFILSNNS